MPAATATFDIVHKNATVDDTLRTIVNAVNQCSGSPFVQKVVAELSKQHDPATDKLGFIKELFAFVCRNLTYQLDIPGIEEVWTPELTLREKIYDCKKGSVFVGSVLAAAGIEPILKHIYYASPDGGLEDWTHIYVIVPASSMHGPGAHTMEFRLQPYITVDTTNSCKFNSEVTHKKSTLYFLNGKKMELHMMGNPNAQVGATDHDKKVQQAATASLYQVQQFLNETPYSVSGISGNNEYFSYTIAQSAVHLASVSYLFVARAAFLGILYLGAALRTTPLKLHWSLRLAEAWQKDKNKVRKTWWLLGGTKDAIALQKAIIKGSGVSISGPYGYGADMPGLYRQGLNGTIGVAVTLATIGTALVSAAPVIIAMTGLLAALNIHGGHAGEIDPPQPGDSTPPATPPAAAAGSMLDFSSPLNTIMKAVLLSSASGCIDGINFYILNGFCALGVSVSIIKLIFKK